MSILNSVLIKLNFTHKFTNLVLAIVSVSDISEGTSGLAAQSSQSMEMYQAGPALLQLLVLGSHCEPIDMHGDGNHDLRGAVTARRASLSTSGAPATGCKTRLHPLPFCPPVLEPDLHLSTTENKTISTLTRKLRRVTFKRFHMACEHHQDVGRPVFVSQVLNLFVSL